MVQEECNLPHTELVEADIEYELSLSRCDERDVNVKDTCWN